MHFHRLKFLTLTFALTLAFGTLAADAAAFHLFEAILTFAETNRLRIECRLAPSEDTSALELEGTITHAANGKVLWKGRIGTAERSPAKPVTVSTIVENLRPELWEPYSPTLYRLIVTARKGSVVAGEGTVRFGFRFVAIKNGQFYLNGRRMFLRGVAINPPGRTIPIEVAESRKFAREYVTFLKSQNLNIFRISTDTSQAWFDACDELGMFMYAGRYGSPPESEPGRAGPPEDFEKSLAEYRALFEQCANHPSIIMYYLANELPVSGTRGAAYSRYLERAHAELKSWDPTRPYIGNAGYGEGREGDVCDVHRYWGWYYNSFLTYYNLRDKLMAEPLFGPGKNQPLTFTECVGAFTGSSGEFNLVRSKQLGPRLGWIGNTELPVEDSLAYQCRIIKEATESFRRMRPLNPRLAGIMPFTILFYNWSGIASFEQMRPKPAMDQLRISYQPILLSWEMWTPQVYAGTRVKAVAHIINDNERGETLRNAVLHYSVHGKDGRKLVSGSVNVPPVPHFGTWRREIPLDLPPAQRTADYFISGSVRTPGGVVSTNWTDLFIAERGWGRPPLRLKSPVYVYDPSGKTIQALKIGGISTRWLRQIKGELFNVRTLVIGEQAWDDHLSEQRGVLRQFVRDGGRIVCLQQGSEKFNLDWMPERVVPLSGSANDSTYPPKTRPHREQSHVNPERPSHPVFLGLDRRRLSLWSDYTGWDQNQPGFPKLHPVTAGFRLDDPHGLSRTAILADYDRGLEGVVLCEMFEGKGSVLLSGFDLVSRAGLDPAADRLLANLIAYATEPEGHDPLPLVTSPIKWGDLAAEQGVVCGSLNGLLVNAEWIRGETQQNQDSLPANTGAWNTMPGDQFVPRGRNPYGRYEYSTGASLRTGSSRGPLGEGFIYIRVPVGSSSMLTTARNPGKETARLIITVNGVAKDTNIPSGKQAVFKVALTGETELMVTYAGPKDLVLVETRFE